MITEPKTFTSNASSPFAVLDDKRYQPNAAVKEWFVGRPSKRFSEIKETSKSLYDHSVLNPLNNMSASNIDISMLSPDHSPNKPPVKELIKYSSFIMKIGSDSSDSYR